MSCHHDVRGLGTVTGLWTVLLRHRLMEFRIFPNFLELSICLTFTSFGLVFASVLHAHALVGQESVAEYCTALDFECLIIFISLDNKQLRPWET